MAKSKMMKVTSSSDRPLYYMLYCRVSTDRQAEEGYSIDIQKEKLEAYVKSLPGSENAKTEFFIDDGFSGGNLDRPEMQRMVDLIESGRGSHVIVYKLDRLSRSQKDTLFLIEDVFLKNDVAFISMMESFNTATAFGRAVVGILSVFAQLERENIYERTRSGMQKRVEAGYWPGGGGTPFGYDYDEQAGILVPNKDAETVKAVYRLYLQGKSFQRIANELGLKYDKLAQNILLRKTNAGYIVYNGVEYLGKHEPIIDLDTYEKAVARYKQRSESYNYTSTTHLLTGLCRCGVCGAKMRYIKWGKSGFRLMCYSKEKTKHYLVRDPNCDNEYFDTEVIENIVIQDVFKMTKSDIGKVEKKDDAIDMEAMFQDQYNALKKKLERLYILYAEDDNDTLLDTINNLKQQMDETKGRLEIERQKSFWSRNIQKTREELVNLSDMWEYMTPEERRSAISSVVEVITLTHDQIDIRYRY